MREAIVELAAAEAALAVSQAALETTRAALVDERLNTTHAGQEGQPETRYILSSYGMGYVAGLDLALAALAAPSEPGVWLRAERVAALEACATALEVFADPYSWHINYDGTGIIFQPDGALYEERQQAFIDAAKAALALLAAGLSPDAQTGGET